MCESTESRCRSQSRITLRLVTYLPQGSQGDRDSRSEIVRRRSTRAQAVVAVVCRSALELPVAIFWVDERCRLAMRSVLDVRAAFIQADVDVRAGRCVIHVH